MRAWLLPVLLLAGVASAELICRSVLAVRGTAFDAQHARETMRELQHTLDSLGPTPAGNPADGDREWLIHPYLGFEFRPRAQPAEVGFALAAAHVEPADAAAPFRVLLLGGAAAADLCANDAAALSATLHADPRLAGREVVLLCGGARWHKQPQHALRLELLFERGLEIDAVVELDGANEIALALENHARGIDALLPWGEHWLAMLSNTHLERSRLDGWIELRAEQSAGQGWLAFHGRFGLEHCALATVFVRGRLQRCLMRGCEIAQDLQLGRAASPASKALLEGSGPVSAEAALRASVRCWAESALTMQGLCEARGITFLHALEPLPLDHLSAAGDAAALTRAGRSSLNAASSWLQLQGVAHVDLSTLHAEEPRAEDAKRLSESLARELLERLPVR